MAAARDAQSPAVVVLATRDRARRSLRAAVPRKHGRMVVTRTAEEFARTMRAEFCDAAIVDVGDDDGWRALQLARELPSIPFFARAAPWTADALAIARAAELDVVDVLFEGLDDAATPALIAPYRLSERFCRALADPPAALGFSTSLQHDAWRALLARAWRPVTTTAVAAALGVSREHLSRAFTRGGGATLKRVADLVRLCLAAELAKNPGYGIADVARLLGFTSPAQLARTTTRLAGVGPASLARLRTVDLVARVAGAPET